MRLMRFLAGATAALMLVIPTTTAAQPASPEVQCLQANNVWVVVDQGNGTVAGGCATKFSNGLEALQSAGFTVAEKGGFVNQINGFPATVTQDNYWLYWQQRRSGDYTFADWKLSNTGANQSFIKPGSIEGWVFGNSYPGNKPNFTTPELFDPETAVCTASTKLADWADKRMEIMYPGFDPKQVAALLMTRVSLMSDPGPSYQKALEVLADPSQYEQSEDSFGDPENDNNFAWKPANAAIASLAIKVAGGDPTDVKGHNLVEIAKKAVNPETGVVKDLYSTADKIMFLISYHRIGQPLTAPMITEILKVARPDGSFDNDYETTGLAVQLLTLLKDTDLAKPAELAKANEWLASKKGSDGRYPAAKYARYFEQNGAAAGAEIISGGDITQLRNWWIKQQLRDGGFPGVEGGTGANIEASYYAALMLMNDTLATIDATANTSCPAPGAPPAPVYEAPVITTQPTDTTVEEGVEAQFSVAYTGDPLPKLTWETKTPGGDWTEVSGWRNKILRIYTPTRSQDGMKVRVTLTNPGGSVTSNEVTLTVTEAKYVTIPDVNLANCICDALSIPENARTQKFASGQLASLNDDLSCDGRRKGKIKDLTGLENLVNLQKLHLSDHEITDLTPVAKIPNLTEAYLNNNPLTDLSGLANAPKLTKLSLGSIPATDLSPLSTLPELTQLLMHQAKATSLTGLVPASGESKLTSLTMTSSKVQNLAGVERLTKLTNLSLNRSDLTDISALANHPALVNLVADADGRPNKPRVKDISALATIPTLQKVRMNYHGVTDASPLAGLAESSRSLNSQHATGDSVPVNKPVPIPKVVDFDGTKPQLARMSRSTTGDGRFKDVIPVPDTSSGMVTYDKVGTYRWYWGDSRGKFSGDYTFEVVEATPEYTITTQPTDVSVVAGEPASFNFAFTGTPAPETTTWLVKLPGKDWVNLTDSGLTFTTADNSVTITETTTALSGTQVKAKLSHGDTVAETDPATLTVTPAEVLTITTQPESVTVLAGTVASFRVEYQASTTPKLTWLIEEADGWKDLDPAVYNYALDGNEFRIIPALARGDIKVKAKLDGETKSVESEVVTLSVKPAIKITKDLQPATITAGTIGYLPYQFEAKVPVTEQWWVKSPDADSDWEMLDTSKINIGLAPGRFMIVPTVDLDNYQLKLVLNSTSEVAETSPVRLSVPEYTFLTGPESTQLKAGKPYTFKVSYLGNPKPKYLIWETNEGNGWHLIDGSKVNYGVGHNQLTIIPSKALTGMQLRVTLVRTQVTHSAPGRLLVI